MDGNRQGKGGGPRNTQNTRFNAVRHGIFTSKVFLSDAEKEEFEELKEEIISTFVPTDPFEACLVDRLCLYILRLQRSAKADSELDSSHGIHKSVRPLAGFNKWQKYRIQGYEKSIEKSLFRTIRELREYRRYLSNKDS